ncbi:MAG: type II toxin-antitoxin system RelE family toxin [Candidatus Dormibacteria bacterium]
MHAVLLTRTAERDLARLPRAELRRIRAALDDVANDASGDLKPLVGARPWIRRRAGDWRVVYRHADPTQGEPDGAYIVARIVNRRDLVGAVRSL